MRNKLILTLAVLSLWGSAWAQEGESEDNTLRSKSDKRILPEAGDFAIGFGLTSPFGWGNSIIGYAPTWGAGVGASVFGKYFLSEETAVRATVVANSNNATATYRVNNDASQLPDAYLFDKLRTRGYNYTLGAGLEKRKGDSRLVFIYGAELLLSYQSGSIQTMDYANAYSTANQNPSHQDSVIFTSALPMDLGVGSRILERRSGSAVGMGLGAFAGVEYFIAPKVSLGADLYYTMRYTQTKGESVTYEYFNPAQNEAEEKTLSAESISSFNTGISNLGASVRMMFYF